MTKGSWVQIMVEPLRNFVAKTNNWDLGANNKAYVAVMKSIAAKTHICGHVVTNYCLKFITDNCHTYKQLHLCDKCINHKS